VFADYLAANHWLHYVAAAAGAAVVVLFGRMLQARARRQAAA
jgi:hypothetical protein